MPNQLTDEATIDGGSSHAFQFRLTGPGTVTVHAVPTPHPTHSDTGRLGAVALMRPGSGAPAAHALAQLSDPFLGLSYSASASDAALAGNWTCRITNGSLDSADWSTVLGGPVAPAPTAPVHSVSFDLDLLNALFGELTGVAALQIHLQSNDGDVPLSSVSWSESLALLINSGGATFHLDDQRHHLTIPYSGDGLDVTFRIASLDSAPGYPSLSIGGSPPSIQVSLRFQDNAVLQGLGLVVPDIDVASLAVYIEVGFDGTINASCDAIATLRFNSIDVSSDLATAIAAALNAQLTSSPQLVRYSNPAAVVATLNSFFRRLVRLDPQAHITGYATQGNALVIEYTLPGTVPHPILPRPVVTGSPVVRQ